MASYEIFLVEPIGPSEQVILVTTALRNPGGYPKGEWFILLPDGKTVLAQATRFNYKEFPDDFLKLDEDFLHREMLDQARLRLRVYINESGAILSEGRNRWNPAIEPADASLFAHRWVRNTGIDHFRKLFHETSCDELKSAIQSVSALDAYERRDI